MNYKVTTLMVAANKTVSVVVANREEAAKLCIDAIQLIKQLRPTVEIDGSIPLPKSTDETARIAFLLNGKRHAIITAAPTTDIM